MIKSKKINIVAAAAVVFALITSVALVVTGNVYYKNGSLVKAEPEYASKIFGPDIISIEIITDEDDWQEMLENAISEQYIVADVVVNGTKFQNVGVRPKGNSSLTQVARSNSDRYSFRLQFDEYIKDQTCFGLDSFVLNNMLGDNTYMKEYVSYELMRETGVNAPYFGFADIKVNGKGWGVYLAVETYGDSYEERTFRTTAGMMYNVKSMDMGWNNDDNGFSFQQGNTRPPADRQDRQFPQSGVQPSVNRQGEQNEPDEQGWSSQHDDIEPQTNSQREQNKTSGQEWNFPQAGMQPPANWQRVQRQFGGQDENFPPAGMQMVRPGGNFGGLMGGRGGNGGSLEYTTDDISAYGAIFNNVVGKGDNNDFRRVIAALKALSEGNDLETYFDVDQILRYLAAHTVVVNLDSYSSNMAQNYFLYEYKGKITILPWDYNLAWGGFQNGRASSVINFPIDTPVSGVEMSSRPLIDKLLSNAEYLEKYHNYLQELMTNYFADGKWEEKITQLDALISDYVKSDSTAFCTYEQYKTAVDAFKKLGNLRYQSIQGQLDGTVPSTATEQAANPDKLIPAGNLNLSSLGSMMGGGNRGIGIWPANRNNPQSDENFVPDQNNPTESDNFVKAQNNPPGNENLESDRNDRQVSDSFAPNRTANVPGRISPPFTSQTTGAVNITQNLLLYSALFIFVMLLAFFTSKKKRNY